MKTVTVLVLVGVIGTVSLVAPGALTAQAGRAQVQEGNRLYGEGRFNEAYEQYLEALRAAPGSPLIRFNEGNALFQDGEVERALESYQAAIESGDPRLQSAAWYNVGNALYQAQQLGESLEAYKQALRGNPGDVDAKHNLERILEQMQDQGEDDQGQQDGDQDREDREQNSDQKDPADDAPQDPSQDQQDQEGGEQNPDQPQDEPDGQGEPEPREGEMSRDEAERLLQAIQEDPDEVNRKGQPARGRKPRKKW